MAGGNFTALNKVRPGVYVNVEGKSKTIGAIGERGTMTMPLVLSWGEPKKVIEVITGEDTLEKLGYSINEPQLLLIREAQKRVNKILLYRLNSGVKAATTIGNLTVSARWEGVRGNDIKMVISKNIDNDTLFDVETLLDGISVEVQTVADIAGLTDNNLVTFSGTGALTETAGTALIGGTDGTVTNQDYLDYLAAVEINDFNTMALPITDTILKSIFVSFCKRMRDDEGKKIQLILENYPIADYEGVISVKNGVMLSDGTSLTAAQCTAWVASATAAAQINESLTYKAYDEAIDAVPRYTNSQIINSLKAGEFVFTANHNKAIVEQDINTLTTFTLTKGSAFSKNRVVRVLDEINNDFVDLFSSFYLGKVSNNAESRNLLKNECINYLEALQKKEAIKDFDSKTDISVQEGTSGDSVLIETYLTPVDAIEKIYVKVEVN